MQEKAQPQPTSETITLHSAGSIPGIPGSHGPGTYLIDWLERTITPVVQAVESEIAHIEEAIHPADAPAETSAPAEVPGAAPEPEAPQDEPEQ